MDPVNFDVLSFIPQRHPFVMIDKLVFSNEKTGRTSFLVTNSNILVEDGHLSEAGIVENIAQTAAANSGYTFLSGNKAPKIGYIGDVKNLSITALPKVGSEIETEISVKNQIFDITVITGRVSCKNKVIAECEMKIFISNQP